MTEGEARGEAEVEVPRLTCRDVIGLIADYLEAAVGEDLLAAFEAHLAACEPCRAYLRTYRATRDLAGRANPAEMPAELRARLRTLLLAAVQPGTP